MVNYNDRFLCNLTPTCILQDVYLSSHRRIFKQRGFVPICTVDVERRSMVLSTILKQLLPLKFVFT